MDSGRQIGVRLQTSLDSLMSILVKQNDSNARKVDHEGRVHRLPSDRAILVLIAKSNQAQMEKSNQCAQMLPTLICASHHLCNIMRLHHGTMIHGGLEVAKQAACMYRARLLFLVNRGSLSPQLSKKALEHNHANQARLLSGYCILVIDSHLQVDNSGHQPMYT